jgi:sulfide dehydrogenase cytochrome subunit
MLTAREGLFALVLFLFAPAAMADLEALKAECDSCHGPMGVSAHPDVPTIAGQTPEFLAKTLRGFGYWDRPCVKNAYRSGPKAGTSTDMCKIASALGDGDISALSAWYAEQTFVPAAQEFDPALATAGEPVHAEFCERCHQQGGTVAGTAPRIAGQWTEYLQSAIRYIPTGERMCPPLMERKVTDLSKEQITQLLNYYASHRE